MSSGPNERLIYFTAGVSLVFMMYSVVRHATTLFATEPEESRNILGMVEDSTLPPDGKKESLSRLSCMILSLF